MLYSYSLSPQKFGRWAMKWFSSRKTKRGFNYFWTTINSWARFKGNWFSDPKRSGPVLGRLPLDIGRTLKHWSTNFPTELFRLLTSSEWGRVKNPRKDIILDCNPLRERIELMVNFTMPCNGGERFVHCWISMTQTPGEGIRSGRGKPLFCQNKVM